MQGSPGQKLDFRNGLALNKALNSQAVPAGTPQMRRPLARR